MTFDDRSLLVSIREKLLENPFANVIWNQLKNPNLTLIHYEKFDFCDGLLYYNGFLYIPDGLVRLQVFQVRHNTLDVGHFRFKKIMELVFHDY